MEDDEPLVGVLLHRAVAVDAEGAPGDGFARDIEVGRDVEAVADAGGAKGVEAVKRIRIKREGGGISTLEDGALVVVNANGVEAHAGEVGGEAVGVLRRGGRVGAVDEVDAAEADHLAGAVLKLEMVADGDDAAELACRLVVRNCRGEVERGARLNPVLACGRRDDGNPVGARLQDDGTGFVDLNLVAWNGEAGAQRILHAGLDGFLGEEEANRGNRIAPGAVILHEDLGGVGEVDPEPGCAIGAKHLNV